MAQRKTALSKETLLSTSKTYALLTIASIFIYIPACGIGIFLVEPVQNALYAGSISSHYGLSVWNSELVRRILDAITVGFVSGSSYASVTYIFLRLTEMVTKGFFRWIVLNIVGVACGYLVFVGMNLTVGNTVISWGFSAGFGGSISGLCQWVFLKTYSQRAYIIIVTTVIAWSFLGLLLGLVVWWIGSVG